MKHAGNNFHRWIEKGYLKLTRRVVDPGYDVIHTCHMKIMTFKVISMGGVCKIHRKTYTRHNTHSNLLSGNGYLKLQTHKYRDKTMIKTPYTDDLS